MTIMNGIIIMVFYDVFVCDRERESMYVCVCVCVRERGREYVCLCV